MRLTEQQTKTIARIIERHVGWMVGWATDNETEALAYAKAARKVAAYLKRIKPSSR